MFPAASAANTRSPILIEDMGVAPTDSTLTVSDPAKQPFVSLDVSGVANFFTESALGAGVVGASRDACDGAVGVKGAALDVCDGAVGVKGAALDACDGAVGVKGAALDVCDGAVGVKGAALGV